MLAKEILQVHYLSAPSALATMAYSKSLYDASDSSVVINEKGKPSFHFQSRERKETRFLPATSDSEQNRRQRVFPWTKYVTEAPEF